MRFIVDLYRYIVFAALGLLIVLTVYGVLEAGRLGGFDNPMFGAYVAGAIALFVVVVLSLGMMATFISIRDRHVEIVDELRALRDREGA